MVKSFVQVLCLLAAALRAVAMPYDYDYDLYYDEAPSFAAQDMDSSGWPFTELIRESPFEFLRREAAAVGASKTLKPCDPETPTGMGPTVSPDTVATFSGWPTFKANATTYGVNNTAFLVSVVNDNDAYQYGGNTFLGWINQPTYSPPNCQQACNALNATGIKCNTYNTCELSPPPPQRAYPSTG